MGAGKVLQRTEKRGAFSVPRFFRYMRSGIGLRSYSLITAADAKIALSMGPVNPKPQHLVFRCHFGNLGPKYGHSACGNRKNPCKSWVFDEQIAPNTVQMRA